MCVINLGADQILSEAMIAGEIVAGVVNIAVSKHSETEVSKQFPFLQSAAVRCAGWFDGSPRVLMGAVCQKPEAAALLDLCSKALINCTRMEAGSESLLSLPEVSAPSGLC